MAKTAPRLSRKVKIVYLATLLLTTLCISLAAYIFYTISNSSPELDQELANLQKDRNRSIVTMNRNTQQINNLSASLPDSLTSSETAEIQELLLLLDQNRKIASDIIQIDNSLLDKASENGSEYEEQLLQDQETLRNITDQIGLYNQSLLLITFTDQDKGISDCLSSLNFQGEPTVVKSSLSSCQALVDILSSQVNSFEAPPESVLSLVTSYQEYISSSIAFIDAYNAQDEEAATSEQAKLNTINESIETHRVSAEADLNNLL